MPEKDNVELKDSTNMVQIPMEILNRAIPQGLQERLEKLNEEHEDNYILHPDKVSVFEVSTYTLSMIDSIPPYHDIIRTSDDCVEKKPDGISNNEWLFTKQGAFKYDRYKVVINMLPQAEWVHRFNISDKKEWDEYDSKRNNGAMLGTEQMVASYMLRSGGESE